METDALLGEYHVQNALENRNGADEPNDGRENNSEIDSIAVGCILLTELCERLVYYSVIANMILYCTSVLDMSSTEAANINLVFTGSVFIIPVFGGYVADTWAGKYKTIFTSGIILIIGLLLLLATAIDYPRFLGPMNTVSTKSKIIMYCVSLALQTIGSGSIKSNIGPLGAQQVECKGQPAVQSFFNWFYWIFNIGALIAYSGVAYVQQSISFFYGYLIPVIVMVLALIIFSLGRGRYVSTETEGSPFRELVGVCWSSGCKSLDKADNEYGGRYSREAVNRVRALFKFLPICGLAIIYWAVYSQTTSTFYLQSERMDISWGSDKVPIAVLNTFDTIGVLILIPIMELLVYPLMTKINRPLSLLQRMGIGMALAVMSPLGAGVLEIYRKKNISLNQTIGLEHEHFNASVISVFAQVPQFTLIGASEVFTSVAGMEFAYSEVPNMIKGMCMGLFLETTGIGIYFSLLLITIVQAITGDRPPDAWFPEEINHGKTENLFFLLAVLMFFNFLFFIYVSSCYKYRADADQIQDTTERKMRTVV